MSNVAVAKAPEVNVDTSYHSVPNSVDEEYTKSENGESHPRMELGDHPQMRPRHWLPTILIQFAFLLWLAPIITLLVFNLKGWNIGASACKCSAAK
jgi:hypothetical protein